MTYPVPEVHLLTPAFVAVAGGQGEDAKRHPLATVDALVHAHGLVAGRDLAHGPAHDAQQEQRGNERDHHRRGGESPPHDRKSKPSTRGELASIPTGPSKVGPVQYSSEVPQRG